MTSEIPETDNDIVVLDFAPERSRYGSPTYDAQTGIEIPINPPRHATGCISAAEAAAAARGQKEQHLRKWDELIEAEASERDYPTEAERNAERLKRLDARLGTITMDLYRLLPLVRSCDDADTQSLMESLNCLHRQCAGMLCELETLAGRDWVAPILDYKSLRLVSLGGYRIDPKTGKEMCPFSHYREPVPDKAG